MKRKTEPQSRPSCIFCKGEGDGVQFAIFNPRFQPFGTACDECEQTVTPQQVLDAAPLLDQSATRYGMSNCDQLAKARKSLNPQPSTLNA